MEAFLAYWVSWFIFPSGAEDSLNDYVFPLEILLAKREEGGTGVNLSGVLVRPVGRVRGKRGTVIRSLRRRVVHGSVFLQIFLQEHFEALVPVSVEYFAIVPSRIRVVSPTMSILELLHCDRQARNSRHTNL